MKVPFCLAVIFIFSISYSAEKADSSKTDLKAGCVISLNSNGISSIPAFSLGKPALIAAIRLAKGRFSFDPAIAYGLDRRPWYLDSWIKYMIVDKPVFKLRTGINISMYFSEYKLPDKQILQGERYLALELAGFCYPNPKSCLSFLYWNDNGQEPGSISGHFISLAGERSEIEIGKHAMLSVNLQVFYIDYDGKNDGLFFSPKISSSVREIPFSIFFQATQAINSNISPFPGFKWNLGLTYTL